MKVAVVGLGAIGSSIAYDLSKLGLTGSILTGSGKVEESDIVRGMYSGGTSALRCVALGRQILRWTGASSIIRPDYPIAQEIGASHVFLADAPAIARKKLVELSLVGSPDAKLVIDVCVQGNEGVIYTFDPHKPEEVARWKASITDAEQTRRPVGNLAAHGSGVLGGLAVWQLMLWEARRLGDEATLRPEIRVPLDETGLFEPTRNLSDRLGGIGRTIHVVGVGATGSRTELYLMKLQRARLLKRFGVKELHFWDFDVIESHNIANQTYSIGQIGKPKVEAMLEIGRELQLTDESGQPFPLRAHAERVTDRSGDLGEIVFLLVDTFAARREIVEGLLSGKSDKSFVIETRLGPNYGYCYSFAPGSESDRERWLGTLGRAGAQPAAPACGGTITVGPTASLLAGLAVGRMVKTLEAVAGGAGKLYSHTTFDVGASALRIR